MSRPLRLLIEDGHYHITARTWDRSPLFRGDEDRRQFLDMLDVTVARFDWRCLAYCLMGNHFHLLIRTPLPNLPRGMQRLNSRYAQWFNRQRGRRGPVFEDRYHGKLVQREPHLLELFRYIALNPVRAGLCTVPHRYAWSSHAATAGLVTAPSFLARQEVHDLFESVTGANGRASYGTFVAAADDLAPCEGPVRGDVEFVREVMRDVSRMPEIPRRDWSAARPPLFELLAHGGTGPELSMAYRTHGYTMSGMAEHLGCHVSTISRRIAAHEQAMLDCKI